MKAYLFSFLVGCVVGVVYAAVRVRSPAPPVVALIGLLGMLAGENGYPLVTSFLTTKAQGGQMVRTHRTGIATARFVDHVGMTVPDMGAAIRFFEHALGARLLWRGGPFNETPTGVAMESVEIAMLRLGPSINLELLAYCAEKQQREMPSNIDIGAGHIAVFVDDLNAAAASLEKHSAELLAGPLEGAGEAKKGERIWYFKTPWGAFMEILTRPRHLPYEKILTTGSSTRTSRGLMELLQLGMSIISD